MLQTEPNVLQTDPKALLCYNMTLQPDPKALLCYNLTLQPDPTTWP